MKKTISLILCVLLCLSLTTALPFTEADAAEDRNIPVSEKIALLNAAPLSPVVTGYEPLDTLVQQVFSEILTEKMTTYEKVRACFAYLMEGKYTDNKTTTALYSTIWKTINYASDCDRNTVCEAYGMLVENRGFCNHFAAAMMVMTRAIGLDSYVFMCNFTSVTRGAGSHYATVIRLNGKLYMIDPSMNVVSGLQKEIETSVYFLTPLVSDLEMEFCNAWEQLEDYGGFQTKDWFPSYPSEELHGSDGGNVGLIFGSYPQSRVDDVALLNNLNELLDLDKMRSYGYAAGSGTVGSQKESAYMRYADVEYGGEKYRAVVFSAYRPAYTYYASTKENSKQDENGYDPGTVYWFRFEPIEWQLLDGDTLYVADLLLDVQPYNKNVYEAPQKKNVDGKTLYRFADAALTVPCNDWSRSTLREWLNRDFFDTAFSTEEKAQIRDSSLKNYGKGHYYDYEQTEDKIFLLSVNEVENSDYLFAKNVSNRSTVGTDYAKCQGLNVESFTSAASSCWLLRSAGIHSEDVCMVSVKGEVNEHTSCAYSLAGIRPAFRLAPGDKTKPQTLEAPRTVQASASATGQITVTFSPVNGADGYKVYMSPGKNGEAESVYTTKDRTLVLDALIPGTTYSFRATAFVYDGTAEKESPASDPVEEICHVIVQAPTNITGKNTATGEVTLQWDPVPQAAAYRVYRYAGVGTLVLSGYATGNSCVVSCLYPGYTQVFRVTAVSADGYESGFSIDLCRCYVGEISGSVYQKRGDVNADNRVDAADARLALRVAVGIDAIEANTRTFRVTDVSFDGVVSAEDARLILRAAVGLEQLY